MKKKLSLLVALLMVLTLIPFNAFAVKTNFNTKQTVGDDEKNIAVSAVLEVETADVVTDGTVTIALGENAEFVKSSFKVTIDGNDIEGVKQVFDSYALFNLNSNDVAALKASTKGLRVDAMIDLDSAKLGDQKWTIDATGIKLGKYERVYAVVEGDSGKFTKRIGDSKVVGRGGDRELAPVELTAKDGKNYFELRLPSDDFKWNESKTGKANCTIVAITDNGRSIVVKADNDKAVIKPVISVDRNASYGDIEIEVTRAKEYVKNTKDNKIKSFTMKGDSESEYVVLGQYKEYGIQLKTVKDVKEEFVNGDTYSVDMELTTDNKTGLANFYDFVVEGADVWITNVKSGSLNGPAVQADADDEFTVESIALNTDKVKFTLNVKPDWNAKGEVVVKVMSRYREEAKCVALKLVPVATIKTEAKEILAGERKIAVNDVVITETKAGALKPGTMYAVSLQKMKFDYAKFEGKGSLEAEGIKVKDLKVDKKDQTIYFTVDSRSKKDAPAKIVLKDLQVVTDRALPLGNYDLLFAYVDNTELTREKAEGKDFFMRNSDGYFELKEISTSDFFKAVSELGRVKKTTVFTLGSADYTVDGVAMKLDAPVFTQDNYTMLPVRAIADALGVEVVWNQENKTATFIDGDKVVSITVNSKVLYKNGIAYPMATKSSVKAERMFISISSVGDAFGLNRGMDYMYNEAAKTVTIYPKAEKVEKVEVEKVEEAK